jgi:hypothetical protein
MLSRLHKTLFTATRIATVRHGVFAPCQRSIFSSNKLRSTTTLPIRAYPIGIPLTAKYVVDNHTRIQLAKENLKNHLDCDSSQDLGKFVDVLFDFKKASELIKKIDTRARQLVNDKHPTLFDEYEKVTSQTNNAELETFLKMQFLPALRNIVRELAKHYKFDTNYVESIHHVLPDDDYMDLIAAGKLVIDIGENGHGPLPHIIAAFIMGELESERAISSATQLYQSLAERSYNLRCYSPDKVNYLHRFALLLDANIPYGMFSNPATFSNFLLFECETLRGLASICKKHSDLLSAIACKEWEELGCSQEYIMGKIIDSAKYVRPR